MMRYSVQPRDLKKAVDLCFLLKLCAKILVINIIKNLSGKYSLEHLHHAKQSATDGFKTTSEKNYLKIAESSDDIGNKIANRITKISKMSQQHYWQALKN